ncbi:hypothetical protein C1H46_039192 [Malus baccata]|uniref:Uncharacterized protein n=1 Tax=Malus baccata TaxID=106549 RepID=A0A540KM28_MALBA|nr:hypothetical protein C1H46_039192 [Malus baccata]
MIINFVSPPPPPPLDGGSSKDLAHMGLDSAMLPQFLGFPGAFSYWNGTKAEVCSGVVSIHGGPSSWEGSENSDNASVLLGSDAIDTSYRFSLRKYSQNLFRKTEIEDCPKLGFQKTERASFSFQVRLRCDA